MKNPHKNPFYIFWIFIFLGILTADTAFGDDIKVGILLPFTGKLSGTGEIERKSFEMAVGEINEAGGVKGKEINLIFEDTATDPQAGRAAIDKLISQDRVVVVGGGCSSPVTQAVSAVCQEREIPFLVNTASADEITESKREYIFRLNTPASEYSGVLLSFISRVARIQNVAILYENTPFGNFGLKTFSKLRRKKGLRVLFKNGYELSTLNFRPLLTRIKAKDPDLVYMVSHLLDATAIMQQAAEVDLKPRIFWGSSPGFAMPEFQEYAGVASEYVYTSTLWSPSVPYPNARSFYERFSARYSFPTDYHGAQAYAAMYVLADALKRCGSLHPQEIRAALAETDLMTVYGPVKFISYGKKIQQNSLPTYLNQWINGRFEVVWPREVATMKYVYPLP